MSAPSAGPVATGAAPVAPSAGLVDVLSGFVGELRAAGIPVSMTEHLDAVEAVGQIPLDDKVAFKYALGATLVKSDGHWRAFETIFDVYFSAGPGGWADARDRHGNPGGDGPDAGADPNEDLDLAAILEQFLDAGRAETDAELAALTHEELLERLYRALLEGDEQLLAALARQAVNRYAGMEPGRPVGGTYYLYRTLRHLDLEGVRERLRGAGRAIGGFGSQARDDDPGLSELADRLAREEFDARIEALRRHIEAEIRRRLVADRGAQAMAKTLRKPLPEDVDFMHATHDELASLRRAIQPLTRRLAVRLARKRRRGRRGSLDYRNTVRHSLSYGGVPVDLRWRDPRPAKPEIVVIADVSGSVAAFARFTLQLVHAINSQFSRVRSFAFIDGIDEVTSFFEGAEDIAEAVRRVNTEADVVWVDGHSDYGHALETFWARWGAQITPRTSVIILGDARNNYHAAQAWVVQELAKRARHVYWLNPEPRSYWDTGDSVVSQYALYCEGTYECRNLRQLERFVEQLA